MGGCREWMGEARTGRFSRVDVGRVSKPAVWWRKAIPARPLSPADRCICQSVADVSGSFHVVTRHVVIIVRFYLAPRAAAARSLVTTPTRNAVPRGVARCNLQV